MATKLRAAPHALQASKGVARGAGLIRRDGLVAALERGALRKVTVISAPPGSGKTSLLRAWAERGSTDRRVAFVSVPRDQQDALQFWLAVLAAIGRNDAIDDARRQTVEPAIEGDVLVDRVVAELDDAGGDVVLIIDDLHELRSKEAVSQLERLINLLPPSAHVVLSSRGEVPVRLHRLRLAGEVAELRAGDLRFTAGETGQLLAAAGITLSEAGTAVLYERTEGWAAGLRLAVISLSGHPDPDGFVAAFSGTDRAIGEYLMAEMLERQPLEVQQMLLRTSVADYVSGELADLLAGRTGCEQMLLALEDANAFVISLDARRTRFRYHQLLSDFLRLELRRTLAPEVPELHRRAAAWFADHGEVVEAIRHRLAAGDWATAARALTDHLFSLTLDGQEGTIAALLQSFPAAASAEHPELAVARAATELAHGRLEDASAQLALAEAHVNSASPSRRRRLGVAIASLRLALARRSGRFAEVIEQVQLLDASTADGSRDSTRMDAELRAVALMNLGIVETWSGRFADAQRHVTEGAALAHTVGRPYIEVACRAYEAFPSVSLATARERAREAFALAERQGLSDSPVLAPGLGAAASIAVWVGEFDEGDRLLRRAWHVVQSDDDPATAVLLHLVTGMLSAGRRQHDAALHSLTAAVRAQSRLTGAHILGRVVAEWLAATQTALGMLEAARATIDGFVTGGERVDAIDLGRAAISLAEGDPAGALTVLGDPLEFAAPSGFPAYALVEAQVLAGRAHVALGDRRAAAAAAEGALAAAESDRLIFPFAMYDTADLLAALPRHTTAHGALLADVLDLIEGVSSRPTPQERPQPVEHLSPSELRVLRFLPTNLTRPEIAQSLFVSINTVNTHIRSIYGKLGATDRSSAVRHARELRLIGTGRTAGPAVSER